MPFNINSFKTNGLVYDGARPSLFSVNLSVPAGIGISNVSVSKFSFVCRSANLPEFTLSHIETPYFGRKIKLAGERSFGDWTVTVMNDEDFSVRAMFEAWSNAMNRIVSNVRDPALGGDAYKTDLQVIQYAKTGEIIRSYTIVGAFPTSLGSIALDWDSTNSIEAFPVTFTYDYFIPNVETSSYNAGGVSLYGGTVDADGPLGS